MRRNHSQTAKRRSHHAISGQRLSKDASGSTHLRHRMNPETGTYRGRVVIDITKVQAREAARETRKQEAMRAAGKSFDEPAEPAS